MSDNRTDLSSFPTVVGYEIHAEERRDRLGVVYRSRQLLYRREVSLRLVDERTIEGGRDLTALCRVARDAARLTHPNLMPVLEVGDSNGRFYLVSESPPDTSLRQRLAGRPMAPEAAVQIMITAAGAVQCLHDHRVLHLGLTSACVFVEEFTPYIADLGLAEVLQHHPHSPFPGEPACAAPEQLAGKTADARTDVYGLGCLLYECLTGRPPYQGRNEEETARLAAAGKWPAPRELNPDCPAALERIICKALAARPASRYASAAALAADLEHFQRGEGTGPSALTRAHGWIRRHPALVGMAAVVLLALVCGTVVSTIFAQRAEALRMEAEQWRIKMEQSVRDAQSAHDDKQQTIKREAQKVIAAQDKIDSTRMEVQRERDRALEAERQRKLAEKVAREHADLRERAEESARSARETRDTALTARAHTARQLDRLQVGLGTVLLETGDYTGALVPFVRALTLAHAEKLPEDTHRLRIAALLSRCSYPLCIVCAKKGDVVRASLSADGKQILVIGANGVISVRGADTGKLVGKRMVHGAPVVGALLSPDGKRVLSADGRGQLRVWNVADATPVFDPVALEALPLHLAFSGDGKRFLTVLPTDADEPGGAVQVYDTASGGTIGKPFTENIALAPAALSADGKQILLIGTDNNVRRRAVATQAQIGPALEHDSAVVSASFHANDRRILTVTKDSAHVWDGKTGKPIVKPLEHAAAGILPQLDESGRMVLTCGKDGAVHIQDLGTGKQIGPALRMPADLRQAVLAPDGRHVLLADAAGTVRFCTLTGQQVIPQRPHGRPLQHVALSPDGTRALTFDGRTISVEDMTAGEPLGPTAPPAEEGVFWNAGATRFARVQGDTVTLHDAVGKAMGVHMKHKGAVQRVVFSPRGDRVLTASVPADATAGTPTWDVRVWDAASGKPVSEVMEHLREVQQASFTEDGGRVLTIAMDQRVRLWEAATGKLVGKPLDHNEDVLLAVVSPDGQRVATSDKVGMSRTWNAATGDRVGEGMGHDKPVHFLTFSADSKWLATCCEDGTVRAWEVSSGKRLMQGEHSDLVTHAVFSADSKLLLSASSDGTARVWTIATGKPHTPPLPHGEPVQRTAFSEDGKLFLTAAGRFVRIWDATNGEPLGPPLPHSWQSAPVTQLALSRTGELMTEAGPGTRWTRPLVKDSRPATDLAELARVLSGRDEAGPGQLTPISVPDLESAWDHLTARYAADLDPPRRRLLAWARRGAAECEERNLWAGVVRHLDVLVQESATPALHARRAHALAEMGRYEGALADYNKALEKGAGQWQWWAGRGDAAAALGRWEQAAQDYLRAAQKDDNNAALWRKVGRAEAERGQWKKAADALTKGVRLAANDPAAWYDQALAQVAAGDLKGYRQTCGRLVKKFGKREDVGTQRLVADACVLAPEALTDFRAILDRAEKDKEEQVRLAALLLRAGQAERAATLLEKSVTGEYARPVDLWLLVLAYQKAGKQDKAKEWLAKARTAGQREGAAWQERIAGNLWRAEAEAALKAG